MSKQWSMRESENYITVINEHGDAVFHEDKHCDGVMDDARLIAAAPELLEALESLVLFTKPTKSNAVALNNAHNIIAKARGEA